MQSHYSTIISHLMENIQCAGTEASEGNEKCVCGGVGGGAKKRGAESNFPREALKISQFPLRKRSRSISCTVFYPKERFGNLKVTGW